jgi:HAD superfamily hydrolase (TIGR01509 family)
MIAREMHGHDPSAIERAVESYFAHYESTHDLARAFDGINALLEGLKSDGLKLGLMTGKGRRAADITLRALGWQSTFAFVVTGDDISQPKPSPEGILRVARELQADPARCAYVGDLPVDIQAGRAAGMATIAAGWAAFDDNALRDAEPDFWAATPDQVRAIFNSAE